ncbi:odorant receptor 30a-like [Halyomorpha halys]|uniref:odorant receptor 30a-like n=1 Tax=Halyomorpha halys TaxID=286706 RepID=UPI0034D1EB40
MIKEGIKDSDIIDGLSLRYLKFFGIWRIVNEYRTTGKKNAILKLHLLGTLLLGIPYVIFQFMSYFVIKVDIQKATILNFNAIPALQLCCRMFVFTFCMESQCRLYNVLRKDFLNIPKQNLEVKEIFMSISKTSNFCCTMSLAVNGSIVLFYIIYPGVSVDYILYHTGSMAAVRTGRKKILGGWYPVPIDQSPYYEIVFAYEAIVLLWGGFFLAVYFVLFYQVLMCLYAQFSALGLQMSSLKIEQYRSDINTSLNHNYISSTVYEELYKLLKDHQKLLRYTEELRNVYNPLVTMTLGMGILILIIGAFQFLFSQNGSNDPARTGKLFYTRQSSDLQFAIYSSDWYKADIQFRKTAQMLMVRANKGVTLTAIRMYPVNVETLMAILQFTYSVSTLMSRMTE